MAGTELIASQPWSCARSFHFCQRLPISSCSLLWADAGRPTSSLLSHQPRILHFSSAERLTSPGSYSSARSQPIYLDNLFIFAALLERFVGSSKQKPPAMFLDKRTDTTFPARAGRRCSSTKCNSIIYACTALIALSGLPLVDGLHHMAVKAPRRLQLRKEPVTPLLVTNYCAETIWPGVSTQSGDGPKENGFELQPGKTHNQTVSEDWQGRVWGRTNCSFNDQGTGPKSGGGRACRSGDCNGILNCQVGVSEAFAIHAHISVLSDHCAGRRTRITCRIHS